MWKTDAKNRPWLAGVVGGVIVLLAVAFWQGWATPRIAYAQIPDSGAQFNELITEMKAANAKLTEVVGLLREIRDAQVGEKKDKGAKPK